MYDVIVIGSRVAGAATARLMANKNYKVLMLDRASFPSDTLSTHLLQPRAMAYLYYWGLYNEDLKKIPGFDIFHYTRESLSFSATIPNQSLSHCLQKQHGWEPSICQTIPSEWKIIRRYLLDNMLVKSALQQGAELIENATVKNVKPSDDNTVITVNFSTKEKVRHCLKAKFVVIACGRSSNLTDKLGAKTDFFHDKSEFCFYNYFSNVNLEGLAKPVHLKGRYAVSFGYTNHDQCLVSVWGPTEYYTKFRSNIDYNFFKIVEYCYPELHERLLCAEAQEKFKGITRFKNTIRTESGKRWLAVGDAASCLSQSTAIGITNAFIDAEYASFYLSKALDGSLTTDEAMRQYSRAHRQDLFAYVKLVSQISECNLPTKKDFGILHALQNNKAAAQLFIEVISRVKPTYHFFNPVYLSEIMHDSKTSNSTRS